MEVEGKVIAVMPEVTGVSRSGNPWKKRDYVIETFDQYPKKIAFDLFGDRADQFTMNVGDTIKLYFDIESREYNGKYFTNIRGWKVEHVTPGQGAGQPMAAPMGTGDPFGPAPAPAPAAPAYNQQPSYQQPAAPAAPAGPEDLPF